MIRKAEEMATELRQNMRGGDGSVEVMQILKAEELSDNLRLFARMTMQPGASIGVHQHLGEAEVFYILSGTATVEDDGEQKQISAGEILLTNDGGVHSIANTGNEPLVFIAVILTK